MSDFDVPGDRDDPAPAGAAPRADAVSRRLIPMQIGETTVFIEATADEPVVDTLDDDEFHAVGVNPKEAFETAMDALKECVRVVGERIDTMAGKLRPSEVGVEFTMTFDVEGRATIIPVLLTGKASTGVGITVSAKWEPGADARK